MDTFVAMSSAWIEELMKSIRNPGRDSNQVLLKYEYIAGMLAAALRRIVSRFPQIAIACASIPPFRTPAHNKNENRVSPVGLNSGGPGIH
jgi:hypothetical protein